MILTIVMRVNADNAQDAKAKSDSIKEKLSDEPITGYTAKINESIDELTDNNIEKTFTG